MSMFVLVLNIAQFDLVYVLVLSEPHLDGGLAQTEPGLGLVWSSFGCSSLGVRLLFLLPVFLKRSLKTSSRNLASRASCAIKHWSYWCCCARSTLWCQTLFSFLFFYTSPPPLRPPYLPHLESIKQLWKEGENLTTANVFSMPGKVRGTPFIRLKHPCWIFWGLFLFFGGKFLKPLNQSFTLTNLLHPLPPFFSSKHAAVCCCCCYSSSAGGHKGKVPYHTPEINRE